jgi:hypothetical protein
MTVIMVLLDLQNGTNECLIVALLDLWSGTNGCNNGTT